MISSMYAFAQNLLYKLLSSSVEGTLFNNIVPSTLSSNAIVASDLNSLLIEYLSTV